MVTVKPDIKQKLEVDIITDDGREINDILEDICTEAHEALTISSMKRQELDGITDIDEKIKEYENIIFGLEASFCHILNVLND